MEKHKQKFFKTYVLVFLISIVISCAYKKALTADSEILIMIPPSPLTEGELFWVSVSSSKKAITSVSAEFHKKEIVFFPEDEANHHRFKAMVGVEDGLSNQKLVEMIFKICTEDLACVERKEKIQIVAGKFLFEKLKVPPRTIFPNKEEQRQIARDAKLVRRIYQAKTEFQYWDPPVIMPIQSSVTSFFGTRRIYNGQVQSVHYGTDLKADKGTPVKAPLTGRVALARWLYLTGYTIILDHGYGFFTIYAHLSRLKVKEGMMIHKEKIMGLSGATGRASGPHLHWGVNLHGVKVDPLGLLRVLGG